MTSFSDRSDKFCIIGAGSSGLAAAKNFRAAGIPFDCLEREDDIGGNWYYGAACSRVYASTHLVSSKRLTEYSDFPMPQEWAEYPSHRQTLEYLRAYARRFGLYECIGFGVGVEWIEPITKTDSSGPLPLEGRLAASSAEQAGEGVGSGYTIQSPLPGASHGLPHLRSVATGDRARLVPPHQGEGTGGNSQEVGWDEVPPEAGSTSLPVGLRPSLRTSVRRPDPSDFGELSRVADLGVTGFKQGGGWRVRLSSGEERIYRGVVIANGHNWDPRWPEYPGEFAGEAMHSAEYKTPEALSRKRVLVVGGGNSGCDIACEAAVHARRALLSTRRSYHILPKFFRGKPIDQCNELLMWLRLPLTARRMIGSVVNHLVLGPAWRTGVPKADHKLFESHPILNSQLHHHVGHGRLQLRPDVSELAGSCVRFVDGREEEIDLIIYATGYRVTFPFIDNRYLNWHDGAPRLFMNVFHPERDDLFCIGLIQPDSGQFGIVDDQAQLVSRFLQAKRLNAGRAAWFGELKSGEAPKLSGGVRYLSTPRHALEVEHYSYRRRLRKLSAKLG